MPCPTQAWLTEVAWEVLNECRMTGEAEASLDRREESVAQAKLGGKKDGGVGARGFTPYRPHPGRAEPG